jgi:L-fuconolactonase
MHIIDTHCHIGLHKYEPVESLLYHMGAESVSQAVLIQHMGEYDNQYHVDVLERHAGRFASVMQVPPTDDGTLVRSWAQRGQKGIRLRPTSRSQAADPLAVWRAAADLDLVVSVLCGPRELLAPEFGQVLTTFPDLRVVIEHLGGVGTQAEPPEPPYDEFRRVLDLARHPALYMKIPGLGEFCPPPPPFAQRPPLAHMAVEAFGPERLMWGSDYPPVSGREGYHNALHGPLELLADLRSGELEWIFGGTASGVWGL